ncbi:Histidine kinase-, DNA gyrase B-, and HSP90-like ATPase [Mucilaginibacter mallensis]|uniref:histidine kinase n=1 Tax=Mucilaginibacter mallensis TaxID=652787 RepID=A0A1H1Y046_MUCMA|nr:HAMP domain-containing sensor histidine kinase [Mucilaginibacter mallensis]SDT14725.1 Histidine kinase-, DNA gyrase B-, and HSP90-like ATPase [Mucilaginibacter mallensis]
MKVKELNERDHFSNMLISILAHDLRQPFATFISFIDMIKHTNQKLSQKELLMIFDDMRDTASKSIELLDGLLQWRKSQDSGFIYRTEPLFLNKLIDEANSLYLYDQIGKTVSVVNHVPESQLIYVHKEMLQFINRNILNNATRYSMPGGVIRVSSSVHKNAITVAFKDQGKGMTAEKLKRIFYNQEYSESGDSDVKGAGIALSICRDMIQIMNGKIWAESVPGTGTTFYYSLPLTGIHNL